VDITYKGKEYELNQDPYLSHNCEIGEHYAASFVDDEGDTYKVRWNEWTRYDAEDESDRVDWDIYTVKRG
jgi:hypothetical protein